MLCVCVYLRRRAFTILCHLHDHRVSDQHPFPQGGVGLKTHSILLTHTPQLCLAQLWVKLYLKKIKKNIAYIVSLSA